MLKNTEKKLNIQNVALEINFNSPCEIRAFKAFVAYVKRTGNLRNVDNLNVRVGFLIWAEFIKCRPEVQQWLIEHVFVERTFQPFTIEVRTQEEAWDLRHRLNVPDNDIRGFVEHHYPGLPYNPLPTAGLFHQVNVHCPKGDR